MVTSRIWFTAAQKGELWERWKTICNETKMRDPAQADTTDRDTDPARH
jgi:hypothetical protein